MTSGFGASEKLLGRFAAGRVVAQLGIAPRSNAAATGYTRAQMVISLYASVDGTGPARATLPMTSAVPSAAALYFCTPAVATCVGCAAGMYNALTVGTSSCTSCVSGRYSAASGASACVACASGLTSPAGSSSAATAPPAQHVTANTAPDLPCDCPHCGRPVVVGGPLWLEAIHDADFAERAAELGEA